MKTLIIYDNTGTIFLQMSGSYIVPQDGIQFMEVDSSTHENKIIKSVNVKSKELIMEDIPKIDNEIENDLIEKLQDTIIDLKYENLILKTGEKNV